MQDLLDWIDEVDQRLRSKYSDEDEEKRAYTRTIKLVEEVGELCNEVLAAHKQQRPDKLLDHDAENLSHEFADVIITTLLLAKQMDVDIEKALESKIKKINSR
jgi:NTP pyrophosphatase (non-canonical NTP hydrolase)